MSDSTPPRSPPSPPGHGTRDHRLSLLFDCVQDYAIFTADPQGHVLDWNPTSERIFGYKEEEIIGQPLTRFFPTDEQDRAELEMKTAVEKGRALNEGWHIHKDGSRFWGSGTMTALRNEQGALQGFGKVIRNLTEKRRADEALREVETRLHLLMECVRDFAIFTLDPQGRVLDWNKGAQQILGYEQAEVVGQPFVIFFAPTEKHLAEKELKEATETGRASDDCWHVRKCGSHFFANGVTTALRDVDGALRGFVKVLRDNTERKHMEEELQRRADALKEANRRKDEFLAMLAHELRNPLAPLFTSLHL